MPTASDYYTGQPIEVAKGGKRYNHFEPGGWVEIPAGTKGVIYGRNRYGVHVKIPITKAGDYALLGGEAKIYGLFFVDYWDIEPKPYTI
jgi:hypothetical protein